VDLKFSTYNLK